MNEHAISRQFEHAERFETEAYERKGEAPGTWATERLGPDGESYLSVFHGPDSRELAEEYARFKNGQ
jgi:hypothetical protein